MDNGKSDGKNKSKNKPVEKKTTRLTISKNVLTWSVTGIVVAAIIVATILIVLYVLKRQQQNTRTSLSSGSLVGEFVPDYFNSLGIISDFWNKGLEGQGVKVLVIDTGVNLSHPDMQNVHVVNSNFDEVGHGTAVTGLVGAAINSKGTVGMAPGADIFMWDFGMGFTSSVISALDWAIANGIDVVNMSFGTDIDEQDFHDKIIECRNSGIFLVAAAGNESSSTIVFPGAYEEVISVAALTPSGALAQFSNWNPNVVDVAMYGQNINCDNADFTGNNNLLIRESGTSMASPLVCGLAALILQREDQAKRPRPTQEQMIQMLLQYLPPLPTS